MSKNTDTGVRVRKVSVEKNVLKGAALEVLKKLYKISELPLSTARVHIEISGVSTAVVNAIRRASMDEIVGKCLEVKVSATESGTTDPFNFDEYVASRVSLIPLRLRISRNVIDNVKMSVHAENKKMENLSVLTGDIRFSGEKISEIIFNPTTTIATVKPGQSLHIKEIAITEGTGKEHAKYQMAKNATIEHLDLEQYSTENTHPMNAKYADMCKYKKSTMIAKPKHHRLSYSVSAIGKDLTEALIPAIAACANILERLERILKCIQDSDDEKVASESTARFNVSEDKDGHLLATLIIENETHTIGHLLSTAIFETDPKISFVGYDDTALTTNIVLTMKHKKDIKSLCIAAIKNTIKTFQLIQENIVLK